MTDTPRTILEELADFRAFVALCRARLRLALFAGELERAETWAWLAGLAQREHDALEALGQRSGL